MRIVFTSDLELIRDSVKNYIECQNPSIEVVTTPGIESALTVALAEGPFDLILLDERILGSSASTAVEPLRTVLPETSLAVLTQAPGLTASLAELPRLGISVIPMAYSGSLLLSVLKFAAKGELHVTAPEAAVELEAPDHEGRGEKLFTPRERQVLSLLAQGLRNKEICRHLSIEEVTVRLHLRGIFRKLGVRSRTQAVTCAIERGFLILSERPFSAPASYEIGFQRVSA